MVILPMADEYDLLPPPFAWVTIPSGSVRMLALNKADHYLQQDTTVQLPGFEVAQYPVTNAQYRFFIMAGGYRTRLWWTAAGWKAREADHWTQPAFWDDPALNRGDHPVVGVSWYEAVAYCQWLSASILESLTLLTDAQWQYAAQGTDGRLYPWGNIWDASRCNNRVRRKTAGSTTPVQQYAALGQSPFGVVDLVGNVWEWCRTSYASGGDAAEGDSLRVMRGGGWSYGSPHGFRCTHYIGGVPTLRHNTVGFRIVRGG
jgi:formylglycine-generating enzyme required for sulfatase activity